MPNKQPLQIEGSEVNFEVDSLRRTLTVSKGNIEIEIPLIDAKQVLTALLRENLQEKIDRMDLTDLICVLSKND